MRQSEGAAPRSPMTMPVTPLVATIVSSIHSKTGDFVEFVIVVQCESGKRQVRRRYSAFRALHIELSPHVKLLPFPARRYLFNTASVVSQRKLLLQRFLDDVLHAVHEGTALHPAGTAYAARRIDSFLDVHHNSSAAPGTKQVQRWREIEGPVTPGVERGGHTVSSAEARRMEIDNDDATRIAPTTCDSRASASPRSFASVSGVTPPGEEVIGRRAPVDSSGEGARVGAKKSPRAAADPVNCRSVAEAEVAVLRAELQESRALLAILETDLAEARQRRQQLQGTLIPEIVEAEPRSGAPDSAHSKEAEVSDAGVEDMVCNSYPVDTGYAGEHVRGNSTPSESGARVASPNSGGWSFMDEYDLGASPTQQQSEGAVACVQRLSIGVQTPTVHEEQPELEVAAERAIIEAGKEETQQAQQPLETKLSVTTRHDRQATIETRALALQSTSDQRQQLLAAPSETAAEEQPFAGVAKGEGAQEPMAMLAEAPEPQIPKRESEGVPSEALLSPVADSSGPRTPGASSEDSRSSASSQSPQWPLFKVSTLAASTAAASAEELQRPNKEVQRPKVPRQVDF